MVEITKNAAEKFKLMSKTIDRSPRVEITAGGCNGFDKKFSMDLRRDDDVILDLGNGVSVLMDPMTVDLLANSRIDFMDDLSGSRFVIDIPEAKSTCGCGTSFSL